MQLKTSLSHRILSVVGMSFLLFELIFLSLFFCDSWFSLDLSFAGIPVILIVCFLSVFLLKAGESKRACILLASIWKGKPPLVFLKWISFEPDGITFGIRHICWSAIDEIQLTFFGNLVIKSRAICGKNADQPDIIFKLPFSVADLKTQKAFMARARQERPDLTINKKLLGLENSAILKGASYIQMIGSTIMVLALLDLGHSSFYYLEILKNYYLTEKCLLDSAPSKAANYFHRAEILYRDRLPYSFATSKLILTSNAAAGLRDLKADIFQLQGKLDEAIAEEKQALKLQDKSLKRNLHLVRLLVENEEYLEAKKQLIQIIEEHKSHLNPRLYLLALIKSKEPKILNKTYKEQMDECKDTTFGEEPNWPPGGERFYCESLYSNDLHFILNHLLEKSDSADANR